MRLECRPTVPEVEPAFRAYSGEALRPFLEARRLTRERVAECVELAVERRDAEGTRLARMLFRLSAAQRQALRRTLKAPAVARR
jgi:hypothetical protein